MAAVAIIVMDVATARSQTVFDTAYIGNPIGISRIGFDANGLETLVSTPSLTQRINCVAIDEANGHMYWTEGELSPAAPLGNNDDHGRVRRSNLDGTNVIDLYASTQSCVGLALDLVNQRMYWVEWEISITIGLSGGFIYSANFDGSDKQLVYSNDGFRPLYLALDVPNGHLYWTATNDSFAQSSCLAPELGYFVSCRFNAVRRSNLDGSDLTDLIVGDFNENFSRDLYSGIALDVANGYMYLSTHRAQREDVKIARATLDGTFREDLVRVETNPAVLDYPTIALDLDRGKMYWTEFRFDDVGTYTRLRRANLEIPAFESPFFRTDVEEMIEIPGAGNNSSVALLPCSSTDCDSDGLLDGADNCPTQANVDQSDSDMDGVGDVCDNCADTPNGDQANEDGDEFGDLCDPCLDDIFNDSDGDTICDVNDVCPAVPDAAQADSDGDTIGDACDVCPNSTTLDKLYWATASGDAIKRADRDDSTCVETLFVTPFPPAVAIDSIREKLYWSDFTEQRLYRSNLDGSGVELLLQQIQISGIGIDPINQRIYLSVNNAISRGDLDGSNLEVILSETMPGTNISSPGNVSVAPIAGFIYWGDESTESVYRANLDGSGFTPLFGNDALDPDFAAVRGVRLDTQNQKIYWINRFFPQSIQRGNLDGSGAIETLAQGVDFSPALNQPTDLILDPGRNLMFISDRTTDMIYTATLDAVPTGVYVTGEDVRGMALLKVDPNPVDVLGDCDGSGAVEFADIPCFVDALLGIDTVPPGGIDRSDTNEDGLTNGVDVQSFMGLLLP
jgi:hypothetical protein